MVPLPGLARLVEADLVHLPLFAVSPQHVMRSAIFSVSLLAHFQALGELKALSNDPDLYPLLVADSADQLVRLVAVVWPVARLVHFEPAASPDAAVPISSSLVHSGHVHFGDDHLALFADYPELTVHFRHHVHPEP